MALSLVSMNQVRVTWSGFSGGPGVSTHYFDGSALPPVAALRTFYAALAALLPTTTSIQVPAVGDSIDPSDGGLDGNWTTGTPPAVVVGTGTGITLAAQGAEVVWTTNEIADGRGLRGRTFFVPTVQATFGTDGLVSGGAITTFNTAATTLVGATPKMVLWHRPKFGPKPSGGGPRPLLRAGSRGDVVSGAVARKAVVLTSRRD